MALSNAVLPWTLTMPAGSIQQWTFTLTMLDQDTGQKIPYPIGGTLWEYVARVSATDLGTPVIEVSSGGSGDGSIDITSTDKLSQVRLTLNPSATVNVQPGTYYHSLWMNAGTPNAYTWVTGNLIIVANPQP